MREEQRKVLQMLAEGKITAEEAAQLLDLLNEAELGGVEATTEAARGAAQTARTQERFHERTEETWMDWIGRVAAALGMGVKYTEQLDWTLERANVKVLRAETNDGSVVVEGGEPTQVLVRAWKEVRARSEAAAREFAAQVQVCVEQEGDEIRIYKAHPHPPLGYSVSVRYEIRCPKDLDVELKTSNGKAQIRGIEGSVDAETSNGAIELQGGGGCINLRTSNGKVTASGAHGRVHVHTSNGSIEATVARLEQEGTFTTSNGMVDVKIETGIAPITVTTSNGSIKLTLPSDFAGYLDARTSNGRVHSELAVLTKEGSQAHLAGQIGAGGAATVRLRTSNGSIHLRAQPAVVEQLESTPVPTN